MAHPVSDREPKAETEPGPAAASPIPGQTHLSRRRFLGEAAGAAGVATVAWLWLDGFDDVGPRPEVKATVPGAPRKTLSAQEWRTLEAACDRLLPSEGPASPGARDVNAIGYLDAVLAEGFVRPNVAQSIRGGAKVLDGAAAALGRREFAKLSVRHQVQAIRTYEDVLNADGGRPGQAWIRNMLRFILEAFFGDPVHGGNPREIAWKWAGHRPGFPRPTTPNWRPSERKGN